MMMEDLFLDGYDHPDDNILENNELDIQYNPYNKPFCYSFIGGNGVFVDVRPFYYYANENMFKDEDDDIIYDISRYIPPNHMLLFLKKKETYFIRIDEHHAYELQYSEALDVEDA